MANQELMRIVDGIARDKNIEREQVYVDIEQAVASGLRKQFNTEDTSEFTVQVYVKGILKKLNVHDRGAAVTVALKSGLIHFQ